MTSRNEQIDFYLRQYMAESNVTGLFPVGEVNGSHGVRRPGGASLNAGQVGSLRAAMYVAAKRRGEPPALAVFRDACGTAIDETVAVSDRALAERRDSASDPGAVRLDIQTRMSRAGGHVRDLEIARTARREAWDLVARLDSVESAPDVAALPDVFRNRDLCLKYGSHWPNPAGRRTRPPAAAPTCSRPGYAASPGPTRH